MNLLFLILDFSRTGGTERALSNLVNNLISSESVRGITILNILKPDHSKPYYKVDTRINIETIKMPPIPNTGIGIKKIIWNIRLIKTLKKYLKTNKTVDYILGTGHNINCALPLIKINKKTAIIGCEHIDYDSLPKMSKLLIKKVYNKLDALVVLSETAKNKYKSICQNTIVIPNMLTFMPSLEVDKHREKRILMVGRISPEKGYDRAIEIAKILSSQSPEWRISIFGSCTDENLRLDLQEKIDNNDLNAFIEIKEPIKEIMNKYLKSSIYMMTSYNEAFPMVLLEAMSCSLPIVAFENEGTSEIIKDGYNGYLIKDNDINKFCDKLSILIKDNKFSETIATNAKASCNEYAPHIIGEKWISFLINKKKLDLK